MGIYYRNPHFERHETGAHPERASRISAVEEHLAGHGFRGLEVVEAGGATDEQIERVHPAGYRRSLEEAAGQGGGMLDPDTVLSGGSYLAARHAAGAAVQAVDRVLAGPERFGFCAVRPPGHHAETAAAMGFCLLNNVAIAAAHARRAHGVERVMVVDWDVHHGNGTQEIFYADPAVLYLSIHQSPLFPGTGSPEETGEGEGDGFTVNLPVPAGTGGGRFRELIETVAAPRLRDHDPDLLLVSAGFDAHRSDPLAGCELDSDDYRVMASALAEAAAGAGAPVVACLEGGYDPGALAASVDATILGLAGS